MNQKFLALLILAALLLSGCALIPDRPATVHGSGNVTSETRPAAGFISISQETSADVNVMFGSVASVTLIAEDNILPLIESNVQDGTLVLKTRPQMSFEATKPILINVTVPSLESVSVRGSGNLRVPDLKADSFKVEMPGSGTIIIDGITKNLSINLGGSGAIQCEKLKASQVIARISGLGIIKTYTSDSLDAAVSGSGTIEYSGSPATVKKNITGQGTIVEIGAPVSPNGNIPSAPTGMPPAPTQASPTPVACLQSFSRQPLSEPNKTRDGETMFSLSSDEFQALLSQIGLQSFCIPQAAGAPFIQTDWNASAGTAQTGRMIMMSFDDWREASLIFSTYDFAAGTEYDKFASAQDWESVKASSHQSFMRIYVSNVCFGTCNVFKTYVFPSEKSYVALTLNLGAYEPGKNMDEQTVKFNAGEFPSELQPASQRLDGMAEALKLLSGFLYSTSVPMGEQLVLTTQGQAYSLAFGSGGLRLAAGYQDPMSVRVWNVATALNYSQGNPIQPALPSFDPPGNIISLSYSSDSLYLAAGTSNGKGNVLIWHASQLLKDGGEPTVLTAEQTGLEPQKMYDSRVSFAPQGSLLAIAYNTSTSDGSLVLWDVQSSRLVRNLPGKYIHSLAFSPDGKYIAAGRSDGVIIVWETKTGKLLQTLSVKDVGVTGISYSPDGSTLASVQIDGTVTLWDAETYAARKTLKSPSDQVYSASFSKDGQKLAVGSVDGQAIVFSLREGDTPREYKVGEGIVYQVAFSLDGKLLAATDTKAGLVLMQVEK